MGMTEVHYINHWNAEHNTNWNTPKRMLAALYEEFHFDFDPAPFDWDGTWSGLKIDWGKRNYVNPPYNNTGAWVDKGIVEMKKGKLVVFLLMANTTTNWFAELWNNASEIRFVYPRVKYGDLKSAAPWGSVIVVLRPERYRLQCFRYKWKECRQDNNPLGIQPRFGV